MILNPFRPKPIVQQVVDLLELDPESWKRKGPYELCYGDLVTVWIGNRAYGLDLDVKGAGRVLRAFDRQPIQRRHVWRAYLKWQTGRASDVLAPFVSLAKGDLAPIEPRPTAATN